MKRILLMVLTMMSAVATWAYDAVVDGIYYNLNAEVKTASVTWGSVGYDGDVVIPSEIIVDEATYTVTSIGASAFYYCKGMTSISMPETLTSIGATAFYGCSGLQHIVIPDGVTSIGRHAFSSSGLTEVAIPNSVTVIGEYAFQGCKSLLTADLPHSLTEIDEATFYECEKLKEVTIPRSVEIIGKYAFGACPAIESLSVEEGSEWFMSDGNCIIDMDNTLVLGCKTSVIPDYVTAIGFGAFYFSLNLASVVIPDGINTIGESAFEGCEGMTEVTIGSGVTTIGARAFEDCSALTEMIVPDAVTSIGNSAFWRCTALKKVTIGKGVEYVDYYAFSGCKALREMTCNPAVMIECNEDTFYDYDASKGTLYVPADLVEEYSSTFPWSEWGTISAIVDPTGVKSIISESESDSEGVKIYSIDGRRLQKMQRGINIVNGKKTLSPRT